MPMNNIALGTAIANVIIDAQASAEDRAKITKQWQDIAGCIIDEIKKSTITVQAGIMTSGTATLTPPLATGVTVGATTSTGTATIM